MQMNAHMFFCVPLQDGSTMVIEAAKGGHTNVVKLLLEYPNRVIMNHSTELPQLSAADAHQVEVLVYSHLRWIYPCKYYVAVYIVY